MNKLIISTCLLVISILSAIAQDSEKTKKMIRDQNFKPMIEIPGYTNMNVRYPMFRNGEKGFDEYISNNLVYPEEAKKDKITGKVIIDYRITEEGQVGKVEIISSSHPLLSEEAIRLIKSSGPWIPGIRDGEYKNMRLSKMIEFKLD